MTEKADITPYDGDAWKQHHDLIAKFTKEWSVRNDITVEAVAWDRGIRLSINSYAEWETPAKAVWRDTGKRNVDTMRELAHTLLAACDFVDASNPEWASNHRGGPLSPSEDFEVPYD